MSKYSLDRVSSRRLPSIASIRSAVQTLRCEKPGQTITPQKIAKRLGVRMRQADVRSVLDTRQGKKLVEELDITL